MPEGTAITGLFYNPNIHPYDELMRRAGSAAKAAEYKGLPLVTFLDYEPPPWISYTGEKQARCANCYRARFEFAAKYAAQHGYTHFTSSLFVSPYQDHELMKAEALRAANRNGIEFLDGPDFTKGYREGQAQAKELGLYRQKYCGCIRSLKNE